VGGPFGSSLVGSDYAITGVPVIRGGNLNHGRFISGDFVYVSDEKFANDLSRNSAAPGDIVYTQRGTLGQVSIVPPDLAARFVISQSQMRLRVSTDVAVPEYVYYASTTNDFLKQVGDRAISTGVPHINLGILSQLEIPLPPLPVQSAIAEVLGALDDKIAANTRLAEIMDSVLTLDFLARLRRTESREQQLGAIANVVLGGTPSRARADYWTDGTIPWLNSGAVNATRIIEPSAFITVEALQKSAAKLMPSGATLLAITGATLGQIARLEMRASGNQSIVGVWSDDVDLNTWLYFAIQSRLETLLARSTGAAQQHVSKGDVEQLAVPLPSQSVLAEFSSVATPLLELAAVTERENLALAATRDALLPQLMSGKLRVRDAEAIAADVGA